MTRGLEMRWDAMVRFTHWGVALGFLLNRLHVTKPGSDWHQVIGLAVASLVILRIIWGFTLAKGPARLSAMIPTPTSLKYHFHELKNRSVPTHLHHNPLGAIGIWLFWILLPLVALTGWAQDTDFIDLYPVDDWHYWLVNMVTVLVCIHILAVIAMSVWLRKDLVRAMLPGKK